MKEGPVYQSPAEASRPNRLKIKSNGRYEVYGVTQGALLYATENFSLLLSRIKSYREMPWLLDEIPVFENLKNEEIEEIHAVRDRVLLRDCLEKLSMEYAD